MYWPPKNVLLLLFYDTRVTIRILHWDELKTLKSCRSQMTKRFVKFENKLENYCEPRGKFRGADLYSLQRDPRLDGRLREYSANPSTV